MNNLFSELCLSTKIFLSEQFSSLESRGPFKFSSLQRVQHLKILSFLTSRNKGNLELANVINCFL